jgi:hypothetical protein
MEAGWSAGPACASRAFLPLARGGAGDGVAGNVISRRVQPDCNPTGDSGALRGVTNPSGGDAKCLLSRNGAPQARTRCQAPAITSSSSFTRIPMRFAGPSGPEVDPKGERKAVYLRAGFAADYGCLDP